MCRYAHTHDTACDTHVYGNLCCLKDSKDLKLIVAMERAVLILHPIAQYLITRMLIKLCIPKHKLRPFYRSLHVHTWSDFIKSQTTVDDFTKLGVARCSISYTGMLLNLGLGLMKHPW